MREGIHPEYVDATVTCACGYTFKTRSTKPVIRLEICSNCHPFFTGKQKLMDSAGRVERFQKRFAKTDGKTVAKKVDETVKKAPKVPKSKIFTLGSRKKKVVVKKEVAAPVAKAKTK